jgi:hypothetical protein
MGAYDNANTLTTLNTEFKYIQDKAQSLLPENAVLMKLVPEITESTKEGRKYLVPVQLSHENGITFGDGSVFALNNASSAAYTEIQVDANPMVLLTQISESVANRMANSKQTFITEASLRAQVMYDSLARYLEISMLYGRSASGIGQVTAAGTANTSTTETFTITAASWSAGIWAGAIGASVQFFQSSALVSSGADSIFTVTTVNASTHAVKVTGTSTGCTALHSALGGAAVNICFNGAGGTTGVNGNDMLGLDAQIVGGSSYFNIDPSVYPLWQGQTYSSSTASLTMGKVLAGAALSVAVGGLNSDAHLMVSAATYANLNADQAALRQYDGSYDSKENENGSEGLRYKGPNGWITVVVNNIVKEGEAFLIPIVKHVKRVGAKELSFERPGQKDQFFQEIPGYAGYSLRAGAEFAVLLERPAQACKFTSIVNS